MISGSVHDSSDLPCERVSKALKPKTKTLTSIAFEFQIHSSIDESRQVSGCRTSDL